MTETARSCTRGPKKNGSDASLFTSDADVSCELMSYKNIHNMKSGNPKKLKLWQSELPRIWTCGNPRIRNVEFHESDTLKSRSLSHEQLSGTKNKTTPNIFVKELLSCHLIQTYHNMNSGIPCPTCLVPFVSMSNSFGPMDYHVQLV